DAALEAYEADLAIIRRLCESDPANADWQCNLSVSWSCIGGIREAQGKLDAALEAYEANLAIARRLCESDPANADWTNDLAWSCHRTASVLAKLGREDEARHMRTQALGLLRGMRDAGQHLDEDNLSLLKKLGEQEEEPGGQTEE
ncbi:MAG: tetratricopeptide repeat protein, partial [Candidatus Sumerlaeota bacterium]|nr:tetratricopeptide repeat protein [Candidatus Sumerlaeota bacterium]